MEEEEDDVHVCLVCHRTINGLLNYVNHKKSECTGRKTTKDIHSAAFQSCVNSVNDIRNQSYALTTNSLYTQSFPSNSQQSYNLIDNFAKSEGTNCETVNVLNSQTGMSTTLDVFDPDAQLHDICLKAYSPPATQTASVTHSLFDTPVAVSNQQSSCDLSAFILSPSIFTSASGGSSKHRETASSQVNHGLLNACITNGGEPGFGNSVNIHIPSTYSILSSDKSPNPNGTAININEIISDNHSKSQASSKAATEKVDDFFQSLELMSKANPKADKGSSFNQPLLPISNILSNLTFSSDEEDLGFNFADDVSLDSMSDNSEDDTAPPSNYTGAKWKPGEKPGTNQYKRNRPIFRGKWPPGQVPKQTTAKYYGGRSKGGKNISSLLPSPKKKPKPPRQAKLSTKTFSCNFCNVEFNCRFKYSNHCGSPSHKEKVFGKRDEMKSTYGKGRGKSIIKKVHEIPIDESTDLTEKDVSNFGQDIEEEVTRVTVKIENDSDENVQEMQETEDNMDVGVGATADARDDQETPENEDHLYTAVPLHICTVCDKKFPNKYIISNHLLSKYHRNRAVANRKNDFELLEMYHKYIIRLSPFQCAICRFYFNKAKFFKIHLQSKEHITACEDLIGEMMCSLCQFKTHIQSVFMDHIDSKEHVSKLATHRKLCVVKESHVECRCKYCGLVMRSFTRLKRHIHLKHFDKQIQIGVIKRQIGVRHRPKCPKCDQQFQSQYALGLHYRRKHNLKKPFKCEKCDVAFAIRYDLGMHCKTSKHLQRIIDSDKNIMKKTEETASENTQPTNEKDDGVKLENKEKVKVGDNNEAVNEEKQSECDSVNNDVIKKELPALILNDTPELPEQSKDVLEEITDIEEINEIEDLADTEDEWIPGNKAQTGAMKRTRKKRKKHTIKQTEELESVKKRKIKPKRAAPIKIHKCDHCAFTANSYNDLRPHYLKEHSTQIKMCELCDLVFLSEKAIRLHTLSKDHQQNLNRTGSNVAEKYFSCHVCKKRFSDEKYCKFHTAFKHFHLTSEDALIAEFDGKDATRVQYKDFLDEIKALSVSASVECPECKKTFKKNNVIEHLRLHSGDKPFACKMCPKAFHSSVTLRRHLLGHMGVHEQTCKICGKSFKKKCSFEAHMKIHSVENSSTRKEHKCEECGITFYFEHQIRAHMKRHRKREFACTYPGCHWKFIVANELKYHMKSHSDELPFLCDLCGYGTKSKSRLKRHYNTHTGERSFHCEYCTYKAGTRTHLRRHMRIHIGSKPYKCPYCNYACNTHENLRKHIVQTKKHEGRSIYPCKFCDFGTNKVRDFRNHLFEKHVDCIGKEVPVNCLSSYTGLYDREADPRKPEEGNQIFQVKERVYRGKTRKRAQKHKMEIKDDKQEEDIDQMSILDSQLLSFGKELGTKDKHINAKGLTQTYSHIIENTENYSGIENPDKQSNFTENQENYDDTIANPDKYSNITENQEKYSNIVENPKTETSNKYFSTEYIIKKPTVTKDASDLNRAYKNEFEYVPTVEIEHTVKKPLNSCYISESSDNQVQHTQILDISRPYFLTLDQGCFQTVSNACENPIPNQLITIGPLTQQISGSHDLSTADISVSNSCQISQSENAKNSNNMQHTFQRSGIKCDRSKGGLFDNHNKFQYANKEENGGSTLNI